MFYVVMEVFYDRVSDFEWFCSFIFIYNKFVFLEFFIMIMFYLIVVVYVVGYVNLGK